MNYTFTIPEAGAVFIAFCAAIVTISNAVKAIAAWRDAANRPNTKQDERLDDHERRLQDVEKKLDADKRRMDDFESCMRVQLKATQALLRHGIDGNEVDAMKDAEQEIYNYLIGK